MTHTLIYANYARAADAEPTPERRVMLAFAAAALIDMRLTAAEHSRVERLLRELDPDGVVWLDVINRALGNLYRRQSISGPGNLRWLVWNDSPSGDILAASACVRVTHKSMPGGFGGGGGIDEVTVTREGRMVLQVLRLYLRATTPPIEIPGREAHPGDRAKGQASALIPSGLRSAVMRMPTKPVATYDTPKMHYNTGAPPPHDAKAILRLFQVRLADANAVASTAPHAEGASEGVGTPTDGITVEARAIDGEPDTRCVQIHGPHDVLRWLADDVEALWT